MTPPPAQAPQPSGPRRHPYGSVRLPAPPPLSASLEREVPPPAAPVVRRPAGPPPHRWYGPRIALPPLSIATLRRGA
ncbi:hypothetical protein [Streptomyces chattanoogensis]|uniref:hypothetical protein n=1 Tax=Streptomyces chattanoogensis TaxID=66876 RepID=UPI00099B3268|nr:hypothetical protein [Streptomyces chattanoogensis]